MCLRAPSYWAFTKPVASSSGTVLTNAMAEPCQGRLVALQDAARRRILIHLQLLHHALCRLRWGQRERHEPERRHLSQEMGSFDNVVWGGVQPGDHGGKRARRSHESKPEAVVEIADAHARLVYRGHVRGNGAALAGGVD